MVQGIGGRFELSLTNVNEFTLAGVTLHNLEFIVGGSQRGAGRRSAGRNILQIDDAEYDFAGGVARLMKAEDCGDARTGLLAAAR